MVPSMPAPEAPAPAGAMRPARRRAMVALRLAIMFLVALLGAGPLAGPLLGQTPADSVAQATHEVGGEASLVLPDLGSVAFRRRQRPHAPAVGLGVCALGLLFGLVIYRQLRDAAGARSRCGRSRS